MLRGTDAIVKSALLIESEMLFRQAIAKMMGDLDRLAVVRDVGTIAEAREAITQARVDIAIVDTSLPDGSGTDFIRELRDSHPEMDLVLLSDQETQEALISAVEAGADGFIVKNRSCEMFMLALLSIVDGHPCYDCMVGSELIRKMLLRSVVDGAGNGRELATLSARELDVVRLLSKGHCNKEIARTLCISLSTTKTHVSNIFKRLGVSSRKEFLPRLYRLDNPREYGDDGQHAE